MQNTRQRLLEMSRGRDITTVGLRQLARELNVKNPQTIKYHMGRLQTEGLLKKPLSSVRIQKSAFGDSSLISIPVKGFVSAGPATQFADDYTFGYVKVSSALLPSKNYKDMYAARVVGDSMNNADFRGLKIEEGDIAIIDSAKKSPRSNEYVVAVVDGLANIKKYFLDRANKQIVLMSESTGDYQPIFVHPDEDKDGLISGTLVQVLKYSSHV
jgi:SOS-response transcriptional repressor LexA